MAAALGVIADDFTGAVMIAGILEGMGIPAPVFTDPAAVPAHGAAPVLVLACRSRTVALAQSMADVRAAADALMRAGCARLAYKACATFDSTETGNIGPAADLLADLSGMRPVLMSAGFPRYGTTVHQGHMFYRGRLVSESIKRFDPLTPMPDPDLVRFLQHQTPFAFGLIPHAVLRQGAAAAAAALDALLAEGKGHVLLDATDDGDVEASADLAAGRRVTVAASDPLIIALAARLARGARALPAPASVFGPAAVLAGSVGPVVHRQLAAFGAEHPVLQLDVLDPRGPEAALAEALDRAAPLIGRQPFALTTAAPPDEVARAQAALGMLGAARIAEGLLARAARALVDRGLRQLVVAGGETSGAVVQALQIRSLRALPEGPLGPGFCLSTDPALSLYLKPGKLGADDILLRALDEMERTRP